MPDQDYKLIAMDADIKSLQSEVGRLVESQKEQTHAIGESTVMMGRLCEKLDHSIESAARAHARIDKVEEKNSASVREILTIVNSNTNAITALRASQPTQYQIIGYVVTGLIAVGGAAKAMGLI